MRNVQIKNLLKGALFGLLAVALLTTTVGCSKSKDSKNKNYRPGYGGGYGYGGPGYGGNGIITNVGAGIDTAGRYMVILAAAVDGGMNAGPAYVEGELQVNMPMVCGGMNPGLALEPDFYQLRPLDNAPNGFLDIDMLSGVMLLAQGRYGEALIRVDFARYFQTNVCGFDGMMGQMDIVEVNGYRCGLLTGFSDMNAGAMCR